MVSSFQDGLREAAYNGVCDLTRAGVVGGVLFAGLTATTGAGLLGGLAVSALSAAAYATLCNAPLPPEGRPQAPFTGGQCNDRRYNVPIFYDVTDFRGDYVALQGNSYQVWGKINSVQFLVEPAIGNQVRLIIDGSRDDDVDEVLNFGRFVTNPNPPFDQIPEYYYSLRPVVCTPVDGLPDTCGDPPLVPPVIPPGGNIIPTNITYINNEGDTVNIPITLRLGLPDVNIRGELTMPINVRFDLDPTINFNGDLNFNTGDFNINFGNPSSPPGSGGSPTDVTPGDEPPPIPPGVEEPPPPPETNDPTIKTLKIIKGCLVTLTQMGNTATLIAQGENPDIYAPNLGFVSFFIRVGRSGGWTLDIPIKNQRMFIECPWFLGALDVRGTARPGYQIIVTPVYTKQSFDPDFPPEAIDA